MRKMIKNSLSSKVFLWVFSALTLCSMLVYGLVMAVVPRRYQLAYDNQLGAEAETFFAQLEETTYDEAVRDIYDFCINNNAAATLSHGTENLHFGKMEKNTAVSGTTNIAADIQFTDSPAVYTLIISSLSLTADRLSDLFLRLIPLIFMTILSLSVLSAVICSRVIVAPIARISQISRRMTALDMTWRCDVTGSDEISVLASSLNTMAGRLQNAMDELENANRRLTADVKKFQTLEEQRRNFFAAVSHELKTPLTILKGQIENMILGYGDYQNHEKYLPETLNTAENMERLVAEILAVTRMENMDISNTLEDVSLLESVSDTIENLLPLANDKGIRIHPCAGPDLPLSVNRNLWNKALSNIIGNAVRHSPCGEHIFITLQPREEGKALVIENTGTSIPEDALPHIFTPFYRPDSSRSKATGGSGLGLYIVKTILDLHDMDYAIRNTKQGVAFFLIFNFS